MSQAAPQAAPVRRLHIRGDLALSLGGLAGGGWLADSPIDGKVDPGVKRQHWISRNSEWKSWDGVYMSIVFVGNVNAPCAARHRGFKSPPPHQIF